MIVLLVTAAAACLTGSIAASSPLSSLAFAFAAVCFLVVIGYERAAR